MNRVSPALVAAALATAALVVTALPAQVPTYRVEFLGAGPTGSSGPVALAAVNDEGEAVGNTTVAGLRRSFVASPGSGVQLLPMPAGGTWTEAFDINSVGAVVGFALIQGTGSRAVVWSRDPLGSYQPQLLPPPAGTGTLPTDARAVNEAGDVVGKLGIFGSYVWRAGVGTIALAGFPAIAEDINEERQIIADTYRMDLDTMLLENLGNPTGTGFNYLFTDLWRINSAGQCGGYGNVATGQSQSKQAVRYSDGPAWLAFNAQPVIAANVMGIAENGDTAYHLGAVTSGSYLFVDGYGSIAVSALVDPAYSQWSVTGAVAPVISRGGRILAIGTNATTNQSGLVLLTALPFDDLGDALAGSRGTPVLTGYGTLMQNGAVRMRAASMAPGSFAVLAVAIAANPTPLLGGIVHPDLAGAVLLPFLTDSMGRFDSTLQLPFVVTGMDLFQQAAVLDAAAPFGVAFSNALGGTAQ
ncbi:MAG: hypothetical protein KDE27_22540 [Planctomycetes bacterium]|nr:hypothetical protein [Planctomycetota bacterium]